jgi:hypothetical protein
MEAPIRALAWMEMAMVFRLSQAPAPGVTAAAAMRAEVAEEADRFFRGVVEGAALEQTAFRLRDRSLHTSVLVASLPPVTVVSSFPAVAVMSSLPAVPVATVQAAEVQELSLLGLQMKSTGKPATVATAVAVAAEPAPERLIFSTPYKEVSGA